LKPMRAMAVTAFGRPLQPLELPEPVVPEGHALLRVIACGVCFTDVKTSRGQGPLGEHLSLPHVPGHEVIGEVMESNPPGLVDPGARAIVYQYWPCGRCGPCKRGAEPLCTDLRGWLGFVNPGGFREHLTAPVDRLVMVPPDLDPVLGAPLSCAIGTSVRAVTTRGAVGAGTRVIVIGLGGVGIHTAQVANAVGARTVGIDAHGPTLEAAGGMGLDVRRADDVSPEELRHELNGEGPDVVIDTVGSTATVELVAALVRRGGRIVGVGYSAATPLQMQVQKLVLDEIEVVGSRYASRKEMSFGISLVAEGRVRPVIGMVRPLEAANEVLDALVQGQVVGRAVIEIAGAA
jgi:alcohol dehydrogenase